MHDRDSPKVEVSTKAGLQLLGSVLFWAFDKQLRRGGSDYQNEQIRIRKCEIENALRQLGLHIGTAASVSEAAISAFQFEFYHVEAVPRLVGFLMDQKQMERPEMLEVFPLWDRRIPISECRQDTGLVGLLLAVFELEIAWRKYPERPQSCTPNAGHISALKLLTQDLLNPEPSAQHRPKGTGYADDARAAAGDAFEIMNETGCSREKAVRVALKNYVPRLAGGHFEPRVVFHAYDVKPNRRVSDLVKKLEALEGK